MHYTFNLLHLNRESFEEVYRFAFCDEQIVLDSDADAFFSNVDSRFAGEYHSWFERFVFIDAVVNIQSNMMRHSVHEVLTI